MKPDGIIGHSLGEVACGYADGCLTLEQTILTAYWRAKCVQSAGIPPGAMAAVGKCCIYITITYITTMNIVWNANLPPSTTAFSLALHAMC